MSFDRALSHARAHRAAPVAGGHEPAGLGFAHRARSCAIGLGGALLALIGSALPIAANAEKGIDGTLTRLADTDLAVVARGERVYAEHCASCHGVALEGQPDWRRRDANGLLPAPPHDASGHTWHHADDLLFEIVKYGPARVIDDPTYRSAMPPYESILSDDDIIAALSWIKSRWPDEERKWQEEINRGQIGEDAASEATEESLLERLFK